MNLKTPTKALNRVGTTTAARLKRLGLFAAEDVLFFFPFRYEDYRELVLIKDLQIDSSVTVKAKIELIANKRSFRKRKIVTEALVSDDTGSLRVVWFNQPFLTKNLRTGETVFLSGTVKHDMLGPQMVSPAYEKEAKGVPTHTARLVPMYPLTEGVTQKQMRQIAHDAMAFTEIVNDWLPESIQEQFDLVPLKEALRGIHFPHDNNELNKATERLKFDELFLVQLLAETARLENIRYSAPELEFHETEIKNFVSSLPFTLTRAQKIAAWEILKDIGKRTPMNRLLSGDVGSGKTVVAGMALYSAILNGFQGAIMAPTEILASQHFKSLTKLFAKNDFPIALYTRTQRFLWKNGIFEEIKKPALLKAIADGIVGIVVGTHTLITEDVSFKKLGLVVVDEQHRFGVEQRKMIKEKGRGVHFLSMTATPIPRSLALMVYGDLDVSIINEMPAGRKRILTRLVEPSKRDKAYEFIRDEVRKGRQVFVVCPLIQEKESASETVALKESSEKKSVLTEYEKLSKKIFPNLRVGYLHGKMKGEEKENIMNGFKEGTMDILVATSVVEVGVDVPNATVMMIEGAESFGLAQLHQFRGRVGRSSHQSYCLLFTGADSSKANERLKYFESHSDGFALAEKDLEMRGPGEVYGTTQSGLMELRLAKLTDRDIIKKARDAARAIAPEAQKYPALVQKIKELQKVLHLE